MSQVLVSAAQGVDPIDDGAERPEAEPLGDLRRLGLREVGIFEAVDELQDHQPLEVNAAALEHSVSDRTLEFWRNGPNLYVAHARDGNSRHARLSSC